MTNEEKIKNQVNDSFDRILSQEKAEKGLKDLQKSLNEETAPAVEVSGSRKVYTLDDEVPDVVKDPSAFYQYMEDTKEARKERNWKATLSELGRLTDGEQAQNEMLNDLFSKLTKVKEDEAKAKMKADIEEAKATAEADVMAANRQKLSTDWNDPTRKAWKAFARELFSE